MYIIGDEGRVACSPFGGDALKEEGAIVLSLILIKVKMNKS